MRGIRSMGAAGVLCAAMAPFALGQTYRVIDLGSLGGIPQATSINGVGEVGGAATRDVASGSRFRATRWDGSLLAIGPLAGDLDSHATAIGSDGVVYGVSFSVGRLGGEAFGAGADGVPFWLGSFTPRAVNSAGVLVGSSVETFGIGWRTREACVFDSGSLDSLPGLGGTFSCALAISDGGDIVGSASVAGDTTRHAVLWRNGAAHDLGTLGGGRSQATAVNDDGLVAGLSETGGGDLHAFVFEVDDGGSVTARHDLGVLGDRAATALAVDSAGRVVGTSDDRAFLWDGQAMRDLNGTISSESGWWLQGATAINEDGNIVGWGKRDGIPSAFLLTPCNADFNGDGVVDTRDVLAFLNAWSAREPEADFNGDGTIDTRDVLAFLNAWSAGC